MVPMETVKSRQDKIRTKARTSAGSAENCRWCYNGARAAHAPYLSVIIAGHVVHVGDHVTRMQSRGSVIHVPADCRPAAITYCNLQIIRCEIVISIKKVKEIDTLQVFVKL